jgi:predicted permease
MIRTALHLYRGLLRLLPEDLYRAHGEEMAELFAEELRAAQARGIGASLLACVGAVWDLIRHAPREHLRRRRHHRRPKDHTMKSVFVDVRFALRSFARQKGATALILLTLTLAVAANGAVFTLLDGVFFRPFPFPNPERLVYLNERAPRWNLEYVNINYPDFHAWRENTTAFEAMALFATTNVNVSDGATAERIPGLRVTHDFSTTLGLRPVLGRTFTPAEDRPDPPHVVVIGYGLWQTRFAGARDVVGRTIRINSEPHEIVGVLPPEAEFPGDVALWLPLGGDPAQSWQSYAFDGVARMRPGISLAQAERDLLQAHAPIFAERDTGRVVTPFVMPLRDRMVGDFRVLGGSLSAAVLLVLLIACANVAGAMLARSVFRQREMGIRMAMGATGRRLTRQLLTESFVLAVVAGVAGTLLGVAGVRTLVASMEVSLPGWVRLDGTVRAALFGVSMVLGTALLFGLFPALQARRLDVRGALSSGGGRLSGTVPQRRLLDGLVIAEVALAAILLVAGGLLLRGYNRLLDVEPGFRTDGVMSFGIVPPSVRYPGTASLQALYGSLLERLGAIPGVEHAGAVTCPPLTCHWGYFMVAEGQDPPRPGEPDPVILVRVATSEYFAAAGTPLVHGRFFTETEGDTVGFRPMVVNETYARRFWPGEASPVGRRVRFSGDTANHWLTVVGVTRDERHYGLHEPPRPGAYVPLRAWGNAQSMRFVVSTVANVEALYEPVRRAVRELDPELPVYQLRTMRQALDQSLAPRRMVVIALAFFGALALILSVSGVYAVVSYVAGRRRHELGIRMALGARRGQVVRMVVGHGLRLVLVGLVLGVPAALASARFLSSLLEGLSSRDAITYAAVIAVLVVTGAIAALIPARRALSVAPTVALSDEA